MSKMTKLYKKPCVSSPPDVKGIIPLAGPIFLSPLSIIKMLSSRNANINDITNKHLQPVTYKAT
jgi:hypothetical protein